MNRSPLGWLAVGVAASVVAPMLALAWVAVQPAGADSLAHLVSTVLPRYALTSVLLVVQVAIGVLLLGVGAGWLVAAYEFPGRRVLEVGMILPLAMPAFVLAYAYTDFLDTSGPLQGWLREVTGWSIGEYWFPPVRSLTGAALFLSLALYPYVYMLARNAFAERGESLGEAARSLGLPAPLVWWRVTWPVARPAVVAGLTLVTMETLADFGTVNFFAVDTFSAGIYRAWQGLGDRSAAARLALVLLVAVLLLVWIERRQRGRMAFHGRSSRPARPRRLHGAAAWAATFACAMPVALGFVLPTILLVSAWWGQGGALDARMARWAANTALLSALAVVVVVPLALGLAYAVRQVSARWVGALATVAGAGYAVPGIVLGVGLLAVVGAIDRLAALWPGAGLLLGGTAVAVVYAYCVRFFAVAQHGLEASLKRISPSMDASARTLGAGPFEMLRRVHWPLLRPSIATAALLVFVDCLKELPATLVLRPFNFDTLAVVAYHFAADERLAEAALPSLAIVAVGLLPVTILARSFRRG
ncbi:MAG: iron ABC transporter permease [Burkholderiaceae bacterium]|nr:iron ABC transporter permease [Burkholderiales bacterium]MCZ8337095.1 iron ABC transporter permease [Burkholderiaceae bacterium]